MIKLVNTECKHHTSKHQIKSRKVYKMNQFEFEARLHGDLSLSMNDRDNGPAY